MHGFWVIFTEKCVPNRSSLSFSIDCQRVINSLHVWSKQKSQPNWSHIFIALLVACQARNTGEQQTNALHIKKTRNSMNTTWKNMHNTYRHHKQTAQMISMHERYRTHGKGRCVYFSASQPRFLWQLHMRSLSFFFLPIGDSLIG